MQQLQMNPAWECGFISLINSYLAFSFFHFFKTMLLQLGVYPWIKLGGGYKTENSQTICWSFFVCLFVCFLQETFKRRREEKQENGKCEIEAVTLKGT